MPIKYLNINCNIAFQAVNGAKQFRFEAHSSASRSWMGMNYKYKEYILWNISFSKVFEKNVYI